MQDLNKLHSHHEQHNQFGLAKGVDTIDSAHCLGWPSLFNSNLLLSLLLSSQCCLVKIYHSCLYGMAGNGYIHQVKCHDVAVLSEPLLGALAVAVLVASSSTTNCLWWGGGGGALEVEQQTNVLVQLEQMSRNVPIYH